MNRAIILDVNMPPRSGTRPRPQLAVIGAMPVRKSQGV